MQKRRIGSIEVIAGEKGGRFPFSNTLFIDDEVKVVVDPGAGFSALNELRKRVDIDLVINTHYHLDHIGYNYLFDRSRVLVNEIEKDCYSSPREIALRYGFHEVFGHDWIESWLARISRPDTPPSPYSLQNRHEWTLSTARLDGTFKWGEEFDLGATSMEVVGAPGHTAGFCCLFFPHQGAVYTGDIDLTVFGPWYVKDGDIEQFISSARRVAALPAETFITGHEAGIVSRSEFLRRLDKYLDVINHRDEKILIALSRPMKLDEIVRLGLIYDKRFQVDDWIRAFEEIMVKKHLERMIKQKTIVFSQGYYERRG